MFLGGKARLVGLVGAGMKFSTGDLGIHADMGCSTESDARDLRLAETGALGNALRDLIQLVQRVAHLLEAAGAGTAAVARRAKLVEPAREHFG